MPYPLFHPARLDDQPVLLDLDAFAREFPGESEHVEFKRGIPASRIQDPAVGFSNADGGVCLLGVAPDGSVVG